MSHSISAQCPVDGPPHRAYPLRAVTTPAGPRSDHVVFQGCTGWLHQPNGADATAPASDVAILLCPAVGWDGLHGHHGFRLLADRLALAGHPTLRFHYPSTGDAADLPADGKPDRWAAWQASVDAAADWLRAVTGARRLVLIGLRLGATLAALAASRRDDVAALALLAPVLRGKSYVRQLDMEARMEGGVALEDGHGLELHELRLDPATVDAISRIDLRQWSLPPGGKVALFPQAPSQLVQRCADIWTDGGFDVSCLDFAGLEPLLQEAIHVDLPPPDFSRLLAWVGACGAGSKPAVPRIPPAPAVLRLPGCSETGLRFGEGNRLFGVLCRPDVRVCDMAVVIGNSGRDPHYGIGRFAVDVARGLARQGIASLRMDFAGLGDSPASPGQGDALSPLFEADRTGDIAAAIDVLQRDGYTDFAVHGLCSGAYHAYRAALAESRIGTLLLVNLPVFEWTGGDTVREAMWKSAPTSRLLKRLSDRRSWRRVLFGEARLHAIVQGQAYQLARSIQAGLAGWRGLAAPPLGPERAAAGLGRRGVRMQLLYSPADPGWDALEAAFGQAGARLRASTGADIQVVPGVNHVLTTQRMREEAFALMAHYLTGHSLPGLAMPEARCA